MPHKSTVSHQGGSLVIETTLDNGETDVTYINPKKIAFISKNGDEGSTIISIDDRNYGAIVCYGVTPQEVHLNEVEARKERAEIERGAGSHVASLRKQFKFGVKNTTHKSTASNQGGSLVIETTFENKSTDITYINPEKIAFISKNGDEGGTIISIEDRNYGGIVCYGVTPQEVHLNEVEARKERAEIERGAGSHVASLGR